MPVFMFSTYQYLTSTRQACRSCRAITRPWRIQAVVVSEDPGLMGIYCAEGPQYLINTLATLVELREPQLRLEVLLQQCQLPRLELLCSPPQPHHAPVFLHHASLKVHLSRTGGVQNLEGACRLTGRNRTSDDRSSEATN